MQRKRDKCRPERSGMSQLNQGIGGGGAGFWEEVGCHPHYTGYPQIAEVRIMGKNEEVSVGVWGLP